jgi:hypothetical protein
MKVEEENVLTPQQAEYLALWTAEILANNNQGVGYDTALLNSASRSFARDMQEYLKSYPNGIPADVFFQHLAEELNDTLEGHAPPPSSQDDPVAIVERHQGIVSNTFQVLATELQGPNSELALSPEVIAQIPGPSEFEVPDFMTLSPDEQLAFFNELPPHERQRFAQQLNGMDAESLFSLPPELHPYLDLPDYAAYRANRAEQQRSGRMQGFMDGAYLTPETALLLLAQILTEAGLGDYVTSLQQAMEQRLEIHGGILTREEFIAELGVILDPDNLHNGTRDYSSHQWERLQIEQPALAEALGVESLGDYEGFLRSEGYLDTGREEQARARQEREEYEALAAQLPRMSPQMQVSVIEGLDERGRQILGQYFAESALSLLGLAPDARQLLGLPSEDAPLWEEVEGLLLGMENDEQLKVAYELLEGWDDETSLGQLAALQGSIDKVRTEMAGLPLPAMRQVYQKYYDKRLAKHQAMLELREWVFKQEGEERRIILDYLSRFAQTLSLPPDWETLTLPDLVKLLDKTTQDYMDIPDIEHDLNLVGMAQNMVFWHGYPIEEELDKLGAITVFLGSLAGSMLFEPIDTALTGFSIMRDIATGRVGWGTAFDAATMLVPGTWSQGDELAGLFRRGDDITQSADEIAHLQDIAKTFDLSKEGIRGEIKLGKRRATRNETLGLFRNMRGQDDQPYLGYIYEEHLRKYREATALMREALIAANPDVILAMQRGGVFLSDVLVSGDMKRVWNGRVIPIAKDLNPDIRVPSGLTEAITGEIEAGKRSFILVDSYMGGGTAEEILRTFRKVAEGNPNVQLSSYWLRERFGFERILPDGSVDLRPPLGTINSGSPYASQIESRYFPVEVILGEDMDVIFDLELTQVPIQVFGKDGKILTKIPIGGVTNQNSRQALLRLILGE